MQRRFVSRSEKTAVEVDGEVDWRLLVGSLVTLAGADMLAPALPDYGHRAQLAYLTLVTIPLLTLPVHAAGPGLRYGTRPILVAATAVVIAVVANLMGVHGTTASLAKLTAATCIGLALARMLRSRAEMIAIAVLVSTVDIYSVAGGPTHAMLSANPGEASGFALRLNVMASQFINQIGSSDLLFFALFTAAAVRFGLRRWTTWFAMTASFGLSMLLADRWNTPVPALPLLSAAFLVANADLFRTHRSPRPPP